jgi:pimeloyl-ACP methyl ester carboxylesterase
MVAGTESKHMHSWSDGYISGRGIKLHYYRTGGDKPPLVINHGASDDGLCWTLIAKELEAEYDVILPDARGHGKSGSGRGDYSSQARVSDLDLLIQSLAINKPVIGGHSMGADTCLHYAAAFPDRVRGVFLEDPPIILPVEQLEGNQRFHNPKSTGRRIAVMMLIFKLAPKFIGMRMARKMSPAYPDDEIIPWIDSKRRGSFNFLKSLPGLEIESGQAIAAIKNIGAPVLLFTGDTQAGAIVSPAAASEVVGANPGVQVVQLEGASHDIRRSRFDGYVSNLRAFLSTLYS